MCTTRAQVRILFKLLCPYPRAGREQINMGADSMRVATPDFSQLPRMEFIFRASFFLPFFFSPFFSKGKHVTDFRVTCKRLSSRPLVFKERERGGGGGWGGGPFRSGRNSATWQLDTARHRLVRGLEQRVWMDFEPRSPISSVCYDDG